MIASFGIFEIIHIIPIHVKQIVSLLIKIGEWMGKNMKINLHEFP